MSDVHTPTDGADSTPDPAAVTPPDDELTAKLKEYDVPDDVITKIREDLGATTVADLAKLTEDDLKTIGMKPIPARNLVTSLRPEAPKPETAMASAAAIDALPSVPDDASWLEALKAGGVLRVDQSTVISTIRAALAERVGLFDVPKSLANAMEQFAETSEEQVDAEFFKLRNQLTRRSYADIFAAIEGLDGSFVTDGRKQQLLSRVDQHVWPAIFAFNDQLESWQTAWLQGMTNPMTVLAMFAGGGAGASLPTGIMQPPDTGVLRDHADEVNNAINKAFAGVGVPIAVALAYDAQQIRKTLENPRLPAMIGVPNRDLMLKKLGVAVPATYPRLEVNITRYVLGVLQLKDQPTGNEELQYLGALYMLGHQIPWDLLSSGVAGKPTGIGGSRSL